MGRCVGILAEVVKQAQVLSLIIQKLTKEFNCKVYSDEVKEDFRKPCFFIAATSVMKPMTVAWMQKELTVGITFYPKDQDKNELVYMDTIDRVQALFQVGIQLKERNLKIESIEDDRVGEEQDILQVRITIPYLEQVTGDRNHGSDLIEEVDMETIHDGGRNHQEIFPDVIAKE